MSNLGIPILLMVTLWGAFNVVFKALQMMTDRRDRFQGFTDHEVGDHHPEVNVKLQFFFDWLPIWIGTGAFLLLFTIVILFIPEYLQPGKNLELSKKLCYLTAIIPGIGAVAFLIGGAMDIKLFMKGLKHDKEKKD